MLDKSTIANLSKNTANLSRKVATNEISRYAGNETASTVVNGWRKFGAFQLYRFSGSAYYTKKQYRVI